MLPETTWPVAVVGNWYEPIAAEGTPLLTTGSAADADVRLVDYETDDELRSVVRIATPDAELRCTVGIPGAFNVQNAITATAMLNAAGVDLSRGVAGFAQAFVPGRMQRVPLGSSRARPALGKTGRR